MATPQAPTGSQPAEWALAIARVSDLRRLDAHLDLQLSCAGRLGEFQAEARAAIAEAFGAVRFSRLYFGNEFCERLIPSVRAVRLAWAAGAARGLRLSLLTPYVTGAGLDRCRSLFAHLASRDTADVEIVVNDWGVLHLLRREFPGLRPVLGRLMNRMLRDPRITGSLVSPAAPAGALQALRQSSVTAPLVRGFLARLGVSRVEFDNLIQGLDMDFRELRIAASLYLPYGCVATGRACLIASLRGPATGAFDVGCGCHRECQRYTLLFRYSNSPFDNRDQEFVARGNTYFYVQDRRLLARAFDMVTRLGISRIVYSPGLPM